MLLEFQAKSLLERAGLPVPSGAVAASTNEAVLCAAKLEGPVVIKAQIPSGGRGKSGGVLFADTTDEARTAAEALLGSEVAGHRVHKVLVEERLESQGGEYYCAVLNDPGSRTPATLLSSEGGVDIEDVHMRSPEKVVRGAIDIRQGLEASTAASLADSAELDSAAEVGEFLTSLYTLFRDYDAELVEVNPLVLDPLRGPVALDCKMVIDDGALQRQEELSSYAPELATAGATDLERRGRELGLLFVELNGSVGVLANGAGLTMATLDAVTHCGGRPANFLEIGGENYTQARAALDLVLANPNVRSLLVNFCGAFARTDVMTEGVVAALEELRPSVPCFFSIHGTGEESAQRLVRDRLGLEPYDLMDDAVMAAVSAAASVEGGKVADR